MFERQRAGFARGGNQEIARGKRVSVRVDAQRDMSMAEKGLRLALAARAWPRNRKDGG